MDKYLLEILKDVNTIIIPGLGALTITNTDTGEIMFMPYLKHDDGKLSGYIAEKEGMEENEAKNLIAKYVRDIQSTLDKGDSYDMFQFGSFFKDGDDVDFKNWSETSNEASKPEVKEKTAVEAPSSIPEKKVEKKEEAPKEEKKAVVEPEEAKKETPVQAKPTPPKVEKKTVETKPLSKKEEKTVAPKVEEKKKEPVVPVSKAPEPKPAPKAEKKDLNIAEKEEISANVDKLNKLKKEKENAKQKKKRGAGFWMLIVLIALLVGGGVTVGIFYDEVKQHVPFLADNAEEAEEENSAAEEMAETLGLEDEEINEESAESSEETEDDSMEEELSEEDASNEETIEETIEETPVEEEITEPTPQPVAEQSGNLPFHLVAGAFSSEANANRLAEKLRAEGYPSKVMFGSQLHMVSVKAFATREAAEAGKSEIGSVAPKAWILEWR